jgi:hypothetical protein
MAETRRNSFASQLAVNQIWVHKRTGEQVLIEQIHRKDRQVKLRYPSPTTSGWDGDFEYRTFDLLKKFYRLYSWGTKEITP